MQWAQRTVTMRRSNFPSTYLDYLMEQEGVVERMVDRKLKLMEPEIEKLIEQKIQKLINNK